MIEPRCEPRFGNATAGASAGDVCLKVDPSLRFGQHDLVYVMRTGEVLRVTQVGKSDAIGVVRGVGSTAAPVEDGDELLIVGRAQPESG